MALEIFRLVGSVFVDTEAANKSLKNTDKDASQLGQTLVNGIKSIGKFAAGIAGAATAAGVALAGIAESTREYRTEQGKLTTAFETQNFTAEEARRTYEALNGILGDSGQAVEAANHLAKLAQNEKELNTWTNICTGVFATFGASLPIEGLTEAANETAKVGQVTGPLADALTWAGVSEDAFNESLQKCSSEQERQTLIANTLNGLYSEAADHYRETSAEVIAANEAQDKLNGAMAKIGEVIEPAITKGKELIAEVLEKCAPMFADMAERLIPLLSGAFETLIGWIGGVVLGLQDAYAWMQENEPIVTILAIAIGALTTAIGLYTAAETLKAIAVKAGAAAEGEATVAMGLHTVATNVATGASTAFGAVMSFITSPITLVVAAIAALIAIVYLLVTNWDVVSEAAVKCWEWIKGAWSSASEWFDSKVVQPVKNFFSSMWTGLTDGAKNAWTGIKNAFGAVGSWFKDTFSKACQGVKDVFSVGGKIFDGIKDGIANTFKTVVNGLIGGINKVISVPFNAINTALKTIRGIEILGLKPFDWIKTFSVPQIPKLESGAVLEKGQVGLLEGNGAEAVVPLHQNKKWVSAVARDMAENGIGGSSDLMLEAFLAFVEALPDILAEAFGNTKLSVNNREFARLVKAVG